MLIAEFKRQSSAADWDETIQLFAEQGGAPMWSSVPGDLVLTMTIIPESETVQRDYGEVTSSAPEAVIMAVSTDGTDRIKPFANGLIVMHIDDSDMAVLAPENYSVDKRYRVFVKYQTAGLSHQLLVAILPIFRGA